MMKSYVICISIAGTNGKATVWLDPGTAQHMIKRRKLRSEGSKRGVVGVIGIMMVMHVMRIPEQFPEFRQEAN